MINSLYNIGKVVGCNYEYLSEKLIVIFNYYVISDFQGLKNFEEKVFVIMILNVCFI